MLREDNLVSMHNDMNNIFERYKNAETIPAKIRADWDYTFERYKARGGNHKAELMDSRIKELKVVYDEF